MGHTGSGDVERRKRSAPDQGTAPGQGPNSAPAADECPDAPPPVVEPPGSGLSVRRTCARTGLVLEPSALRRLTRIAKKSRGPFNPLLRYDDPQDRSRQRREWGRYDVPGHRTVYGASPAAAAYGESIAFARQRLVDRVLGEFFSESDRGNTQTLGEVIDKEWKDKGALGPGFLPAQWRLERLEYKLQLPPEGWFVDIEAAQSLSAISQALASTLDSFGAEHLTVAHLRGEDRRITTAVAEWVHGLVLEDGSRAHGIRYGSKHGTDWSCWALWLRALDGGQDLAAEPTRANDGTEIKECVNNLDLRTAAELFRIRCF